MGSLPFGHRTRAGARRYHETSDGLTQIGFCDTRIVPTFRYVVCNVFTDTPPRGNQLTVFTDARAMPEDVMQRLAREMNFSETVSCSHRKIVHARIRIFTPRTRCCFTGHPTLGSAFVLTGPLQLDEIRLETGKGVIPVRSSARARASLRPHRAATPDGRAPYAEADTL